MRFENKIKLLDNLSKKKKKKEFNYIHFYIKLSAFCFGYNIDYRYNLRYLYSNDI